MTTNELWSRLLNFLTNEKVMKSIFALSFFFLAFVIGGMTVFYKGPAYSVLKAADATANSLVKKYTFILAGIFEQPMHERLEDLWYPATEAGSGVIINKSDNTDYILYSDCIGVAQLIDRQGKVLHRWRLPFYEAYATVEHLIDLVPEEQIYWRKARVFEDGSLIAIYEGVNQSPYGGGMVKIDQKSNLVWAAPINAHHDFQISGDNSVIVLHHKYESGAIDDYVAVLDLTTGAIKKSISLRSAIHESPYWSLIGSELSLDYLHTNSIEIVGEKWASECPVGEEGDLFLSHNKIKAITLLDMKTEKIGWALSRTSGKKGLHDPDLMNGCRLAYFINEAIVQNDEQESSQILTFSFIEHGIKIIYAEPTSFFSSSRGSQQELDNGNWLITASNQGTIFEVDGRGNLVWKFISPERDEQSVCLVNQGRRYDSSELPFLFVSDAMPSVGLQ